jgi:FtsH-binding integral membrane protein
MAFAATSHRPIEGAVATVGVSDRVSFLRKTYAHLGVALIAFAAIAGGMMRFAPEFSRGFSRWAISGGGWNWMIVIGAFMLVGWLAERLAMSETSRGLQYLGLGIFVVAESLILQPILWILLYRFGATGATSIIGEATIITLAIFVGLTLTVFLTKKDFSFLRGILVVASFGAIGVILASIIIGFSLGAIFCGLMILIMAGYILFQTSIIMKAFPPTAYVAAALMLFSTIATLFWYVLQLLMSLRND